MLKPYQYRVPSSLAEDSVLLRDINTLRGTCEGVPVKRFPPEPKGRSVCCAVVACGGGGE
ncbi:hypothetical protein O3P69_020456 [Scylla paramamosain]|uniref:Uncharacterized protein n=1 Tax=Scylla paramamosain TaxID=85552 RepID=A0AAW0TL59_SCYPA